MGSLFKGSSAIKGLVAKMKGGSQQYTGIDPYARQRQKEQQRRDRRPERPPRNVSGGVRTPLGMLR